MADSRIRTRKLLYKLFDPAKEYTPDNLDIAADMKPREYIKKAYDSDPKYTDEFNKSIEKELRDNNCPGHLDSVDGHEHISPGVLLAGATLLTEFNENPEPDMDDLYLASECGLYPAMKEFIARMLVEIEDVRDSDEQREGMLKELDEMMQRFALLYWSEGYLGICEANIALGIIFSGSPDEKIRELGQKRFELAMKDFVWASILEDIPQSKEIIEIIHKEKPLEECAWNFTKAQTAMTNIFQESQRRRELTKQAIDELIELTKDNPNLHFSHRK